MACTLIVRKRLELDRAVATGVAVLRGDTVFCTLGVGLVEELAYSAEGLEDMHEVDLADGEKAEEAVACRGEAVSPLKVEE